MKKIFKYYIFIGLVVLVMFGCFYLWSSPQREGIKTERLGAMFSTLNDTSMDDKQKMEIVSKMNIKDKRFKDIIVSKGDPNPVQQVLDLRSLTQRLLDPPQ